MDNALVIVGAVMWGLRKKATLNADEMPGFSLVRKFLLVAERGGGWVVVLVGVGIKLEDRLLGLGGQWSGDHNGGALCGVAPVGL